jgi:hypothetical protein
MSNNVYIFFASCAAALLLGRAVLGCGDGSTSAESSTTGDATSSTASSSGAGGSSSSSASSSSSSGGPCDHCATVEMMGGSTANLCPASKAPYDALELCKCGMLCKTDCAVACNGAGIGPVCQACLDAVCHNELAACFADQ